MARKKSKRARRRDSKQSRAPGARDSAWHGLVLLYGTALLVSANLFVFGPLEILSSNRAEFDATIADVLPRLLLIGVGLSILLFVAGLLVPRRYRHKCIAILLAAGMLLWIQDSFLKWGYGEFNGVNIIWSKYTWQGWVDLAVWLAVFVVAVRFARPIARHALLFVLLFLMAQTGFTIARIAKSPDAAYAPRSGGKEKAGKTMPAALCELSSSRNVFHFLFDGFQTDVFLELVAEEGLSKSLDGFVVYPGNMSTASQTVLSVPSLFSSQIYDGSETQSEYFRNSLPEGFYRLLFEKDYIVNLVPHLTMDRGASTNYYDIPSRYATPRRARVAQASMYLIDISFFRQLPHFLKRIVYNDQNWRLSSVYGDPPSHVSFNHKAFFQDYIDRIEPKRMRPAYHFIHLMPPHGPFVTLSDGSYAGRVLPNTRENYKNEARYILRLFIAFLDKLRALDLYDSSIILMHGDHGLGLTSQPDPDETDTRISMMSALLLLKPSMAHGALESSPAQTSLTDIPATILDLLDIPNPYPGESIVHLDSSTTRTRPVVALLDKSAREPLVRRWSVTGDVSDRASWQELPEIRVKRRIHAYKWGTRLRFGAAHSGDVYLSSGWSTSSSNYSWSDGKHAEIVLAVDKPETDISFRITMFAFIARGKVDSQRVDIRINGLSIGERVLRDGRGFQLRSTVPREVLQSNRLLVTFELPDATVPRDVGVGRESRALAVGLYAFETVPVDDG